MDDPADDRHQTDRPGPDAGPDAATVVDPTDAEWLGMAERARGYLRALAEGARE